MNNRREQSRVRRAATILVLALLTLALTACGGGDGGGGGDESSELEESGGTTELADVKAVVDDLFSETGTYESPPTSAPKPEEGKNIWLISCGQAFVACIGPMKAAQDAAEAMGWETSLFDTKGDPTTAPAGIRRAIADDADGIYLFYIDCRYMRSGLQAANDAGVPVVAGQSADCGDTNPGQKNLFDFSTTYTGGLEGAYPDKMASYVEWVKDWGKSMGLYAVAETDGQANALIYTDDYGFGARKVAEGAKEAFDECADCSAQIKEFPVELLGGEGVQERVQQDLLKNPDVNVLIPAYDAITIAGMAQAAQAAGRDVLVLEGEGTSAGMELMRQGRADAGSGIPLEWDSYASLDALNRIFHDEDPVPSGVGIQLFDRERNIPPKGPYQAPFDYVDIYEKAWAGASG